MAELLSKSGQSLAERVRDRLEAFPSSGEMNFQLEDANRAINRVLRAYQDDSITRDETDGVSLICSHWRFNLRRSNTEPVVRLNVEVKKRRNPA
jgi:phosphomannomutase